MVAWSTSLAPAITVASAPIRSPGRTTTTSPTARSTALTVSSPSSPTRVTVSGAKSSNPRTESSVRAVANASNAPDVAKMTISSAPSVICPIAAAPIAASHHQQVDIEGLVLERLQSRQAGLPTAGCITGQIERPAQPMRCADQLRR